MGLFDTFWGDFKCQNCGEVFRFEEQTKEYDRSLNNYYIGDYVDKGNKNYFFDFVQACPKCKVNNDISVAIRRGQYVGVYPSKEARNINILELDNISKRTGGKGDKMMKQLLGDFLNITTADDHFFINVQKKREQIYFGYNNEIPEEVKEKYYIEGIYLDFASEALGIEVSDEAGE